jgi:hypothetical protein
MCELIDLIWPGASGAYLERQEVSLLRGSSGPPCASGCRTIPVQPPALLGLVATVASEPSPWPLRPAAAQNVPEFLPVVRPGPGHPSPAPARFEAAIAPQLE